MKIRLRLFAHDFNRQVYEPVLTWVARHLPKPVRYWVVITSAVDASFAYPNQEVPTITWSQMLETMRPTSEWLMDKVFGRAWTDDAIVGGGPSWVTLPEHRYRCFVTINHQVERRRRLPKFLSPRRRSATVEVPVGLPVPGADEISVVTIKEFEAVGARSIGEAAGMMAEHVLEIRKERASILWRPTVRA